MKSSSIVPIFLALVSFSLTACNRHNEKPQDQVHQILLSSPEVKSVTIIDQYACSIHSQQHLKVRAFERWYLEEILVKEGQEVRAGDVMFKVIPFLEQTRLDAALAEHAHAQLEYEYTKKLFANKVVAQNELELKATSVKDTEAKEAQARAELNVAIMQPPYGGVIKAPFNGIIGPVSHEQGSLVEELEVVTTIADNAIMWVYFDVPEASYHEYTAHMNQKEDDLHVELVLASGEKFQQSGKIGAIEVDTNVTGKLPFRADFPNPDRLLRHGQTGAVLIGKVVHDAIVIPERATFEDDGKRYVYVIDKEDVAHQREIEVRNEVDDLLVVNGGVGMNEKFVLDGIQYVREGEKVDYKGRQPKPSVTSVIRRAE